MYTFSPVVLQYSCSGCPAPHVLLLQCTSVFIVFLLLVYSCYTCAPAPMYSCFYLTEYILYSNSESSLATHVLLICSCSYVLLFHCIHALSLLLLHMCSCSNVLLYLFYRVHFVLLLWVITCYACAPATAYFCIYCILARRVLLALMCSCSNVLLINCILALSLLLLHMCSCSNVLLYLLHRVQFLLACAPAPL